MDADSVRAAYEQLPPFDAVTCTSCHVTFRPLGEMRAADYDVGLRDKLVGQVNLVLEGRGRLTRGGAFTLTGGVLDHDPIVAGSSAAMVNGALDSFAEATTIEPGRGLRISVVSSGVISEALGSSFRGFEPVPAARSALAYAKSVEGRRAGQVLRVL